MGLLPDPAIRCPPCEPHPAECEGEALVLLVGPVEEGPQGLLHPDAGVPLAGRHPWAPCWAPAVAGGGRPCEGPCGAQYTCARGQAAVRGVVGAGVSQKQRARQGGARTLLVAGDPHGALRGECHRDLPFPRCISTSAAASVLPVAGSCGRDGVKQGVRLDAARQPAVAGGGAAHLRSRASPGRVWPAGGGGTGASPPRSRSSGAPCRPGPPSRHRTVRDRRGRSLAWPVCGCRGFRVLGVRMGLAGHAHRGLDSRGG